MNAKLLAPFGYQGDALDLPVADADGAAGNGLAGRMRLVPFTFIFLVLSFSGFAQDVPVNLKGELGKIDALTVRPLPQSPKVKLEVTDADAENLRGPVRMVFVESKSYDANSDRWERGLIKFMEFGEDRNRIREAWYGWSSSINAVYTYGYIDGMRVQAAHLPANANRFTVKAGAAGAPELPSAKHAADDRYDIAYLYEFKSGRRSRLRLLQNNGADLQQITYDWSGREMINKNILPSGELNQHVIYKYDAEGNEVEAKSYEHGPRGVTGKYSTYATSYEEFDSHHNWTRRTIYEVPKKGKKRSEKLTRTEYRTITYF